MISKKIILFGIICLLLAAHFYFGQNFNVVAATDKGGDNLKDLRGINLTITDVASIINGIACWVLRVIGAVMIIALVAAGIRYFIAGSTGEVASAKKNLNWVLIGIAVILGVNTIIATIGYYVGGNYSFIPLKCGGEKVGTKVVTNCKTASDCGSGFICVKNPGKPTGVCVSE